MKREKTKVSPLAELTPVQRLIVKLWYSGAKIPEISGRTGAYASEIYKTVQRYEAAIS